MAELNRQPALAQFNKLNKKFTTILGMIEDQSLLNHDLYLYKEVEIDFDYEDIEGTYDDFKIYNVYEKPLMTEDGLNEMARRRIVDQYPLEIQLSILGSILEKVADANAIECNDLKEMNDFIAEARRVNKLRKKFYAENPDFRYMSTEEMDAAINEKYEGAIQEYGTDTRDI